MDTKEFYKRADADYADVLRRLMTDERIRKYLHMLPADTTFGELSAAVSDRRAADAFRAAHSLKGIFLNLGLGGAAGAFARLTDCLRPAVPGSAPDIKPGDWPQIESLYCTAAGLYRQLTEWIGTLDE